MKFPKHIKKGDTIGITAPSFGATTEPYITRFKNAIEQFEKLGYKIRIGETCYKNDGLGISTKPEVAAKELMSFYKDDSIDAIISCGGGELMCETMSYVDFQELSQCKPKWFMGYSDNTNFIFPMATIAKIPGIYGPTITGFGKPWERPETDALALLEGTIKEVSGYEMFQNPDADEKAGDDNPLSPYIYTDKKELKCFYKSSTCSQITAEGVLLGGCLDVLANIAGTKLDNVKKFISDTEAQDGVLWVFEECDGNPMDIRRNIWHLDECGWLKNAKGFVIGRPLAAWKQEYLNVNQYNAVTDILSKYNVPIIMDADIGHISPAMPVVIGSKTRVNVSDNDIKMTFSF